MKRFDSQTLPIAALLLGLFSGAALGAQRPATWTKWVQNPPTVPVSVSIPVLCAESNSLVQISLADGLSIGYGHTNGCSALTNAPTLFANLNVRREYLLTVVTTNLQQIEMDLDVRPSCQLFSKSGSDAVPKFYTILVNRQVGDYIAASTNCTAYSNVWVIEIRDQQGAHWIVDDQSNDPGPAPGDANPLQIGPAKSLLTNHITIDWSVSLGRLYDGLAAGRLRLSESSLSREAYTPKAIFYAAPSTNIRSQVELVCAQADGALRQAKAFQCFVDIIDPWTFSVSDITNLRSLATRLATETNGVSLYVLSHLAPETQQALTNYYSGTNSAAEPCQSLLVHDFNALIAGPSMCDMRFWTNVTFSEETQFLLAQNAQGPDLLRLNRLLLQDAYTTQIAQRPYQTALNFYLPAQVGTSTNQDGVYTNITGLPFVSYYVRNPQPTTITNLALVEGRNGISYTNSLVFNPQAGSDTWVLTSGSGSEQKREARTIGFTYGAITHRFETNTVRYMSSNTNAYKCVEDYAFLDWGWELVETRVDPEGANLITSFDFYDNENDPLTYGQPWIIRYPDGDWEVRFYDHDVYLGALQYVLRPFNGLPDDPLGANLSNCEVAWYCPSEDLFGGICTYIYHYLGDQTNTLFTDSIGNGFSGDMQWEAQQRVHYDYPHDYPMGPLRARTPDAAGKGLAGHEVYSEDYQGPERVMYYQGGSFNEASGVFSVGDDIAEGPDWRQSVVMWGVDYCRPPPDLQELILVYSIDGQPLYTQTSLYPGRSTREATVFHNGSPVRMDRAVFTGLDDAEAPGFETVQSYAYKNDSLGHATNTAAIDVSNPSVVRIIHEASYQDPNGKDGTLLRWESDETGARTEYTYDSLKRITQARKVGVTNTLAAVPSVITNITYDACGRTIQRTVSGGVLALTSAWSYDVAGRVLGETSDTGLTTNYTYTLSASGGQVVTIALPSGATIVREQYRDRRLKSQTGTGVVAEFHSYSVGNLLSTTTDIGEVDTVHWGVSDSPRWTLAAKDMLGLPSLTRSPDFDGAHFVDVLKHYGEWLTLPTLITVSGKGITRYDMDFDGQVSQTAQNYNGDYHSGRITANPRLYSKLNGQWFYTQTNLAYLTDNSDQPTVTGVRLERVSGFTSPSVLSEITTLDADTNATVVMTSVDRAARQVTEVTIPPQSTLNPTRITVNGLPISETTATVATPTMHRYDALGRETSVTSPLSFTTFRAYSLTGQVTSETDPTGLRATYEYYANGSTGAGQVKSETRNGKKTYYAYTSRGELWLSWGDVPYPQERVYSQYGELVELHTFRGGSGWNQPTWAASPGPADNTTWTYQDTSGLLLQKTDHAGNSVAYTYENGMVKTRSWARLTAADHVTATYDYNEFGDPTGLQYNDGTPSVQMNNYNRAGLPRQIVDGAGTSTLLYDYASRLVATEYTDGPLAGITVTNHFDSLGRRDSLSALNTTAPLLAHSFAYEDYGRLKVVSTGPYSATYDYLANSDLLQRTTCKNNGTTVLTTTRAWDYGMRLAAIINEVNGANVSSHAYIYDALNRRTQASLEDGSIWKYDYNDRDELTCARRYWPDWSPVSGQLFAYDYDNIGNRKTASAGGDVNGANWRTTSYTANALNEYTSVTTPGYKDICGAAIATNSVAVNGNTADRKVEYFHREISIGNGSGPLWQGVTVASGGGTNTGGLVFPANNQTLTFDADGNLTFDGIWTYEWDGENRLITMTMTNVAGIAAINRLRLEFAYDFQGRRVQKMVSHWDSGNWILDSDSRFVYDGWNLLAILNSSFNLQTSFMWGQDLSGTMSKAGGIGGLLMLTTHSSPATNCFVSYDGNGNVMALLDATNGEVLARYEYSPFGELLRATGPMAKANPFRFSTKFCDEESGLIYYGYRYYNPPLGRWLGRDSAGENGAMNLYLFVANCPPTHFDTLGNMDSTEFDLVMANIRGTFDIISKVSSFPLAYFPAHFAGYGIMIYWFGIGGKYDFGHNDKKGELFKVPGYSQKLTSDQATDLLVGYAAGYGSFRTGDAGYSLGVAAGSTFFGATDFYGNWTVRGFAEAVTGITDATDLEFNGFINGAIDALFGDN